MNDRTAMEKMRCTLDSMQICRLDTDEMLKQQTRLCLESLSRMATLADLPVSIAKRRKGSTLTFKTSVKKNCFDVNGWEHCFTGGSMDCVVEHNSRKRYAKSRRKLLIDDSVVNNSCSLDRLTGTGTGTGTGKANVRGVDEGVILQRGGNELSISCKASNEDTSISGAGKPAQRMMETADLVTPVFTHARAKILKNAERKATVAVEGRPPKKPRVRKGTITAVSSLPAEKDENAGKMQTMRGHLIDSQFVITKEDREVVVKLEDAETLECHSLVDGRRGQSPPKRSLRLKRNGRGTLHSLSEKQGNERKNKAIGAVLRSGDEQDAEAVKLENAAPIVSHTTVEKDVDETPPCKKSRTTWASIADAQAFAEYHIREEATAKKSRSWNRNVVAVASAVVQLYRSADIIETVVARELDSHCPLADQDTMESTPFKSNGKDQGKVHRSTDLPSECLVNAEHSGGQLLLAEPPVDDAADTGHKPSILDKDKELIFSTSTPERHGKTLVEQEVYRVVADHPEFKVQEPNCISVVPAEESVGQEDRLSPKNSGLSEGNLREFSNSLEETNENADGTQRIGAQSLDVHPPADEFENLETLMNVIGGECVDLHSQARNDIGAKRQGTPLILRAYYLEDLDERGSAVDAIVPEYVQGHPSAVKQVRNEMVDRRQGMPLASDGEFLEEVKKKGATIDVIAADCLVDGRSSEVKQGRNKILNTKQRIPLVLVGNSLEELGGRGTVIGSSAGDMPLVLAEHFEQLERKGTGMDATGTEYVDRHSSAMKQVNNAIVETRQGTQLVLGGNVLEVEKRQTPTDAIGAENVYGHSSTLKQARNKMVGKRQGMPVMLCENLSKELEKTGSTTDAIGCDYGDVPSSAAKQASNEIVETRQGIPLVLGGNISEELEKRDAVMDAIGAEYVDHDYCLLGEALPPYLCRFGRTLWSLLRGVVCHSIWKKACNLNKAFGEKYVNSLAIFVTSFHELQFYGRLEKLKGTNWKS